MKKIKKEHGITLVALVITIVVLLILAGISIQAITQNNLFEQAKKAKNATENSQKEENKTLSEYMDKMNEYIPETLASKVNSGEIAIGAYVKYIPDAIDVNSEEYKTLVSNWGKTYSGSESNSTSNIVQDTTLNWRILDVDGGKVRLISDKPTKNTVYLSGYQGYNNAVYLLDNACKVLYNNSKMSTNSQSIKIEDITKYMKEQPKVDENEYQPESISYPKIIEKEENQIVDKNNNNVKKLKISEQESLIVQENDIISEKSKLRKTYWTKAIEQDGFINEKYYDLFVRQQENNILTYWISSRCVDANVDNAGFYTFVMDNGEVTNGSLYFSFIYTHTHDYALRPIVTLNSNIQLDTTKSGEGTESKPFEIK